MSVLLLAATILGLGGVTLGALVALLRGRRTLAIGLLSGAAGWGALYGAGLVAVSLTSRERVLAPGETKRFCGFYLDCHLGAAIAGVRTLDTIGTLRPAGRFVVVTLRISSDAVRASLRPHGLHVALFAGAQPAERVPEAEAALARLSGGTAAPLERAVPPGGSYLVDVVFDDSVGAGPYGIGEPRRLLVQLDGWGGLDRLVEGVLIGDEDSFLHRKTLLALPS